MSSIPTSSRSIQAKAGPRSAGARVPRAPMPAAPSDAAWSAGRRASVLDGVDLLDRLVDERGVVVLRHGALQNLRRNREREVDRLAPQLLDGAVGLELNLALGAFDDRPAVGDGLLAHLLTERVGIGAAALHDAFGLDPGLGQNPERLLLNPLELLADPLGVVDRLGDELPARLERREERLP